MTEHEESVVASQRTAIRNKIEDIGNLPTLPGISAALSEIVGEPESSLHDIAELASKDPALSANLLKLVNAPFYGFPERIASVQSAVLLAGMNVAKAIASSTVALEGPDHPLVGLWEHSLGAALASRLLAVRLDVPDPEEVMVAGLLHDLGKILLHALFPEEAEETHRLAVKHNILIREAELQVLGVDHAKIGGWSAECWSFPAVLGEPISYHHEPSLSKKAALKTAIVHFADVLVHALDFGGGDSLVPPLEEVAWSTLGFTVDDLDGIVEQLDEELTVTATALYRFA